MNKIKLIGLDLDGTLFDDKKKISERNRQTIEKAAAQGVIILPSTGRPLSGLPEPVRTLPAEYALTANGAAIYRLSDKKRIYEACFSWEEALKVVLMLQEYDVLEDCFIDGYGYSEEKKLENSGVYAMSEIIREYIMATRKQVENLPAYLKEHQCKVEKITVNFKEKDGILLWEKEIRERFKRDFPEYAVVKGIPTNLEITAEGASKGNAILRLGKLLGIKREEIMACGDSQNDLAMIEAAGLGVAMGNAVEEVKAAADYVTLSNEEDGVAAVIEKFVLTK